MSIGNKFRSERVHQSRYRENPVDLHVKLTRISPPTNRLFWKWCDPQSHYLGSFFVFSFSIDRYYAVKNEDLSFEKSSKVNRIDWLLF